MVLASSESSSYTESMQPELQTALCAKGVSGKPATRGQEAPRARKSGASYYRARYYDSSVGRFVSEDPIRQRGGLNYYRYVRNSAVNFTDPTGLYALKGFTPGEAARMMAAISQLAEKLRSSPCCIDPKLRDRILNLLQPDNNGSGLTFVWHSSLPSSPGFVTCAQVSLGDFLTSKVEISAAALDGTCGCPLAGTILHETIHHTWKNFFGPNPEPGAYGGASACFGSDCSMPPGLPNP